MGRFDGVLGGIDAKRKLAQEAGDAVAAGANARQAVTGLMHPAVVRGDHLPPQGKREVPSGDMAYDQGTGEGATPIYAREYQREGRNVGAGYLNNPLDEAGRQQIGEQFWEAPLGGHVRGALEGQELFGHRITGGQARMAEQGLAGLTAVGIGVPTFLTAVHNLTTPQDQGIIPM